MQRKLAEYKLLYLNIPNDEIIQEPLSTWLLITFANFPPDRYRRYRPSTTMAVWLLSVAPTKRLVLNITCRKSLEVEAQASSLLLKPSSKTLRERVILGSPPPGGSRRTGTRSSP